MQHTSSSPETRFLRQVLLGAAFLGAVAVVSLPAARGAGALGWMPMWLLGMPLAALATLALVDLRRRGPVGHAVPAAASRRRARPAQARRRPAGRPAPARRRPGTPAAA